VLLTSELLDLIFLFCIRTRSILR
jgi:transketolase